MIGTETYLGPAVVTHVGEDPGQVEVTLPGGAPVHARMALPLAYTPVSGDELLVIGAEEYFVIGVLRGRGATALRAPGDLSIEAPEGRVTVFGSEGVSIRSEGTAEVSAPSVRLRAGRLELFAGRILEKARDLYSWVSGLFHSRSGRLRVVTDSTCHVKASRIRLKGDKDVSVDGNAIHLG